MWELDHKDKWAPKNWCFWTVVMEKTLESPLDCREIQPVHPKGNQSWIFTGRTDAEAAILWPPDAKNWVIGKDPNAGKDWRQEEKGTTEDEMVRWHHGLSGREFEPPLGIGDGQGGLVCCSPWGRKEWDMTEWLNWTELNWKFLLLSIFGFIFFFLAVLWGMQDPSSLTRNQNCAPEVEKQTPNPWTTREFPQSLEIKGRIWPVESWATYFPGFISSFL